MRYSRPARFASLVAAGALTSALLAVTAPAAHAAPVFVDADTQLDPFTDSSTSSGACVTNEVGSPDTNVPVVENGPSATLTATTSGTSANGGDTATMGAQWTATGSVKSVGGNPSALDFTGSGSAFLDFALPASGCTLQSYAGTDLEFGFVVTEGGFMHFEFKNNSSYSEVWLYKLPQTGNYPYYDHYGRGLKFAGTDTVYLPPGSYEGYFEGMIEAEANVDSVETGSTSVHATFNVAGSQTEAVSGKGKKYVTFPAARSCATDSLVPSITGKKKRANKIKQVKFFVDDKLVKKVRTPDKGDDVKLAIADDVTADVRAQVKLFPARKGRPGKVLEVTTAYEACS